MHNTIVQLETDAARLLADHRWAVVPRAHSPQAAAALAGLPVWRLPAQGRGLNPGAHAWLCDLHHAAPDAALRWAEAMQRPLQQTSHRNELPWCAAYLRSACTAEVLRHHLTQLLRVRVGPRRRDTLCWQDPAVFIHLLWILSAPQCAQLFGPVQVWTIPLEGQWLSAQLTAAYPWHGAAPPAAKAPLRLSPAQCAELLAVPFINRVMARAGLPLQRAFAYGPRIAALWQQERAHTAARDSAALLEAVQQALPTGQPGLRTHAGPA